MTLVVRCCGKSQGTGVLPTFHSTTEVVAICGADDTKKYQNLKPQARPERQIIISSVASQPVLSACQAMAESVCVCVFW